MPRGCIARSVGRPSDIDVAWLAGLIEGEGSFSCITKDNGARAVRISVRMTDKDVLDRLREIVNTGNVIASKERRQNHHKPIYVWQTQRKADAMAIMRVIYPFMGERRQAKIRACFMHLRQTSLAKT